MNLHKCFQPWLTWTVATVVALFVSLSPACVAADKPGANNKHKKEKKKEHHEAEVSELRAVRELLHSAVHDYNGHRGHAMHHISEAIHALHHKAGKLGASTTPGETQQQSDAKLRQAMAKLTALQQKLAVHKGKEAQKASAEVGHAIKSLNVALSVK